MSLGQDNQIMMLIAVLLLFICFCCCSSSLYYYMNIVDTPTPTPTPTPTYRDVISEDIDIVPQKTHRDILVDYGRVGCEGDEAIYNIIGNDNGLEAQCDVTDALLEPENRYKRYNSVPSGTHFDRIVEVGLTPACKSDEVLNSFQYFKEGSHGMRLEYSCVQVPTYPSFNPVLTENDIINTQYDVNSNQSGGLDIGSVVNCTNDANGYPFALNKFTLNEDSLSSSCTINYVPNNQDPIDNISAVASDNTVTVTYVANKLCTIRLQIGTIVEEVIVADSTNLLQVLTYDHLTPISVENLTLTYTATSSDLISVGTIGTLSFIHFDVASGVITTISDTENFTYQILDGAGVILDGQNVELEVEALTSDVQIYVSISSDLVNIYLSQDSTRVATISLVSLATSGSSLRLKAILSSGSIYEPQWVSDIDIDALPVDSA